MRERVGALDALAAYRRVGVVTTEDHHASSPESRPEDRVQYLSRPWLMGVLSQLPDGAGPARVRAHTPTSIAVPAVSDKKEEHAI
jgi:hypothetical protein